MVRDFFFPGADVLPRKPERRPEGLGTHLLWARKGEWSCNDSLAQLLMPKEWARVEALRKTRRERILRERACIAADQAVPSGIAAGRIVADEMEGAMARDGSQIAAALAGEGGDALSAEYHSTAKEHTGGGHTEGAEDERAISTHAADGATGRDAEDSAAEANGQAGSSHDD